MIRRSADPAGRVWNTVGKPPVKAAANVTTPGEEHIWCIGVEFYFKRTRCLSLTGIQSIFVVIAQDDVGGIVDRECSLSSREVVEVISSVSISRSRNRDMAVSAYSSLR